MHNSSFSLRILLLIVLILGVTTFMLFFMGRTPWYTYGPPQVWSGDTMSNQNSQQLFDQYTFTHIIHGFGFYLLLWIIARRVSVPGRLAIATLFESAWEIIENTSFAIERYRTATLSRDYYGDSILNSLGDILTSLVGFLLAAALPITVTIGLTIVIEAILLLWIRDSLLLNIIMLLYPSETIKNWQIGK